VDVAPLVPKLRKNKTAHIDYIRHTQEEAATLREIIESDRLLSPLNTSLAYACKYTRQIQELLMILQQTCPSITDLGTNLVAVTPKNKTKQIRRTAQITKSERTTVATSPSTNIDSNTPVLSSIGVTLVSSASGSKSQDNAKKNRIRRTQKKAKETELEDHLRIVKSSLNKTSVVNSKATSSVIKSVSNVNSNLKCAFCNGCLFFDNHDACVVAYIRSVNARKKSKSVNTPVKRKVWKSTSKVFKTVGYKWKPTGRTFTLVGNVCPLTSEIRNSKEHRNIDYAFLIWEDFMYQVEHKNQKKSNKMYYPRFTKVIIHHFMSKDLSIPRQNKLTNEEIRNTKAYKEYYACATGEAALKPKASAKRKRSGLDTSITPPTAITTPTTTGAITPRLTTAAKGKQPAKAKSPSNPSELARTEAQQLK
nr:hypothetical protein [Tanacetum cinerariifolium]